MFSQEWTRHLKTQEQKDEFYKTVRAAKPVLDRLKDLIEEKENSMEFKEMSLKAYDNPNWAYYQAHQNGFKQALVGYKRLIDLDQKETTNDPNQPIRTAV